MKQLFNYNAFDIISLVSVLLENDSKYSIKYDRGTSLIIIERQNTIKEDK